MQSIPRICQHCGVEFFVYPAQIRKGHGHYCSQKCSARYVMGTPEQRFWKRVIRCLHDAPCLECCWIWQGSLDKRGYGRMVINKEKRWVHHVAWELVHGYRFPLSYPDMVMRHLCHTPACVNISHLAVGSQTDNMHDSSIAGRLRYGVRHPQAKLNDAAVQEMRRLRATGMFYKDIAAIFDVHEFVARSACQRHTWRHVP